jgi:hypothetical protein
MTKKQSKVYVIHENEAWVEPLFKSLEELNVPYCNWFINDGKLNLADVPPEGVFYNRMSASAHSREHRYAIELTESILTWLEFHQRKVINNRNALTLEVRKSEQQLALTRFGISTPKTIVVNNKRDLFVAAKELNIFPFIIKPNRGGKGLGVKLYQTIEQLEKDIESNTIPESLDGVLLVQEYIKPQDGRITRMEFIGGEFYYAVSIDSTGGFELCPADSCNIGDEFCPATPGNSENEAVSKFKILEEYTRTDLQRYKDFLDASGIKIGAIEYVRDASGKTLVYDVNTNTNYNSGAENKTKNKYSGMYRVAEYLKAELDSLESVA